MRSLIVLAACLVATAAQAQLDLSGATAPAPAGTVVTPKAARPRATESGDAPRPKAPASPSETTLAGKTLALNGGRSQISFVAHDKTVQVSRLLLTGRKLSNGRDECQIDVSGMPLALTPLGKVDGLNRFSIPVPACPLTFDVLNGAVLVSADAPACGIKDADCSAQVTGLWGAQPGDLGPDQVKTIERERTAAEKAVRAAYKGLVSSTKDRPTIKDYASDQAGFSSHREEVCRDYIGESRHGFCDTRLTQARATALETQLATAAVAKEARRKKKLEHGRKR